MRCTMPNATLDRATAAGTGIHLAWAGGREKGRGSVWVGRTRRLLPFVGAGRQQAAGRQRMWHRAQGGRNCQARDALWSHFVREVRRKPRNTVSSSSGASRAVVAMREAYVEKSMVMMEETGRRAGWKGAWVDAAFY